GSNSRIDLAPTFGSDAGVEFGRQAAIRGEGAAHRELRECRAIGESSSPSSRINLPARESLLPSGNSFLPPILHRRWPFPLPRWFLASRSGWDESAFRRRHVRRHQSVKGVASGLQ